MKFFHILIITALGCGSKSVDSNLLSFSADTLNFGSIKASDTLNYSFHIKNNGEVPIKIADIYNSCGCVSVKQSKSELVANDSVMISIQYIPKVANDTGSVTKFISFRTNSTPPLSTFTLIGKVVL